MEPQDCFYNKKNKPTCVTIIIFILLALLIGTVGIIIGATQSIILLMNIQMLITISVVLIILLIIAIIAKKCIKENFTC